MAEQPEHYKVGGEQWLAADFIRRAELPFDEASVVKYVCRHKKKDGAKDVRKAIEYLRHILRYDYGEEDEQETGIP